jgi:hypothetical protein
MFDWLITNRDWVFSGAGIAVVGLIFSAYKAMNAKREAAPAPLPSPPQSITQSVVLNTVPSVQGPTPMDRRQQSTSLPDRKNKTRIVFVDDDLKFKVVKILTNSGWVKTLVIKDVKSLDEQVIEEAHILFIDVQGVGVAMGFDSEGLGLAMALKDKYPSKKIVIYSAETKGDRFHQALRRADSFLSKNADPYEFQKLVEELSLDIQYQ